MYTDGNAATILNMAFYLAVCLLNTMFSDITASFLLPDIPGQVWKRVGYLNMSDPTQQCPDSWQKFTSPVASCAKKGSGPCDSVIIATSGASYQMVCGVFLGYEKGTPDAFNSYAGLGRNLETYYVDGVSITYGSPGNRHHVYTYAAGNSEFASLYSCPCAGGTSPPSFVGSDYYCESGNPLNIFIIGSTFFGSDVLWDRQLCRQDEVTCCDPSNLPWFCKTFPTPVTQNLEVRICLDEALDNENVALEFFDLYILDLPTIWSPQPTVYGVQGNSVQLICTFDGLPVPNITWTSPNGSILTSQQSDFEFMIQSTNTSTMLMISVVGLGDSGTYTCNATNSIGVSSASILLIVQDPPTIWSPQPTVYGVQGHSVQLNCSFDGLPVPNITWTSPNGSVLTSQSHFMIQSTNTSTTLTISVLGLGDTGTYTCNATNSIGVYSASILLIVQDPPTIWSPQPTVYGVQGYSVQLNCTFDGLPVPNITWTSPNGSVLTSQSHFMIQSSNTSTTLTISVLGLGDKGTYTCNATNSIGVSSAPIQLIVKEAVISFADIGNNSKSDISIGAVAIGLISGAAVIVVLTLVIAIIAAITCFQTKKAREHPSNNKEQFQ